MHKPRENALSFWVCIILSCSLVLIGMVLMIAPEAGEIAFGPYVRSVHYSFETWNAGGTFVNINDTLRELARVALERDNLPSISIIDSPSTKTTEVGGERGFDGGTKGERA